MAGRTLFLQELLRSHACWQGRFIVQVLAQSEPQDPDLIPIKYKGPASNPRQKIISTLHFKNLIPV